jgi:hypothetical protein
MKISKSHQEFTRHAPDVIENPERTLGSNCVTLLNFWHYLDALDAQQWRMLGKKYVETPFDEYTYFNLRREFDFSENAFWNDVFDPIYSSYLVRLPVKWAAYEIYILDAIIAGGRKPIILPLFDNLWI